MMILHNNRILIVLFLLSITIVVLVIGGSGGDDHQQIQQQQQQQQQQYNTFHDIDRKRKTIDLVVQSLEGLHLPADASGTVTLKIVDDGRNHDVLVHASEVVKSAGQLYQVAEKIVDGIHMRNNNNVNMNNNMNNNNINKQKQIMGGSTNTIQQQPKPDSSSISESGGGSSSSNTNLSVPSRKHSNKKKKQAIIIVDQFLINEHPMRVQDRMALISIYTNVWKLHPGQITNWLSNNTDHCMWKGIICETARLKQNESVAISVVTRIELSNIPYILNNVPLPEHEIVQLKFLTVLQLSNNLLTGTIPKLWGGGGSTTTSGNCEYLNSIVLNNNLLTGTIPVLPINVIELYINNNYIYGSLASLSASATAIQILDISDNIFTGSIPHTVGEYLINLQYIYLSYNQFTSIPNIEKLNELRVLDISYNNLYETYNTMSDVIKTMKISNNKHLLSINLSYNNLYGTIPESLFHYTNLYHIILSGNQLHGTIPDYQNNNKKKGSLWKRFTKLGVLMIDSNHITGTIPINLLIQQASTLKQLDISDNEITGTIPTELGLMTALHTIDAQSNHLYGTIPNEMLQMNPNLRLNFTDNRITGTIPGMFCGHGASSMNMLYREFGCDAVLCRTGTFNVHGHATLHSACRPCLSDDPNMTNILGRISCPGLGYVHGDLDGDGLLSPREILRIIYVDNLGRFWGPNFQPWADTKINECDLLGITCVNGKIARIDLTSAELCSNGDRRPGPIQYCKGLPAEIGELSSLEVLQLTKRQFLRGTIPTEFGKLSRLRLLDISTCTSMTGTLPTELGKLSNLRRLLLSHSRFRGTLPSEILVIPSLEKLHLTNNLFTGTLPKLIGKLTIIKEFMISRNSFSGTIPKEIGDMAKLENFEAYHNSFTGTIPKELAKTNVKRIDIFANNFSGRIPSELASAQGLQIIHLKENELTGTIPSQFGTLPYLSWFDVSQNFLTGTIPLEFANSQSLEDFRVGGNMLYGEVPQGLCSNPKINGGATKDNSCDGIVCPVGTFSDSGYAEDGKPCSKCPENESSMYLGSTECIELSEADILSILFEVMRGNEWREEHRKHWGDNSVSICEWSGVDCDSDGDVISLGIPLMASSDS